jgi:hypothetical protein
MAKWLSRGVAPVIQAMMRGQLPAAEQQELVRQLCASVAQTLPEFALSGMVLELLQVDLQAGARRAAQGLCCVCRGGLHTEAVCGWCAVLSLAD